MATNPQTPETNNHFVLRSTNAIAAIFWLCLELREGKGKEKKIIKKEMKGKIEEKLETKLI